VPGDGILLSHGEGGKRTRDLIRKVIAKRRQSGARAADRLGLLGRLDGEVAFTTDDCVLSPAVFPGGDIGRLAVCGTLNDLSVAAPARRDLLLAHSRRRIPGGNAGDDPRLHEGRGGEGNVVVACGDTRRGKGNADGIFITTAGVGIVSDGWRPAPENIRPGDRVILTGTMGDHQAAVLIARNRLELSARILSDVAPLSSMLLGALASFGKKVRFMRDPSRGGVGVALNEMAETSGVRIVLDEIRLPVAEGVRGICEILGFDPLYLANEEGAPDVDGGGGADRRSLRKTRYGQNAAVIGEVTEGPPGVSMKTAAGGMRAVDYPVGDQLPRIC
jgi:hydrogenase expression/formation protein HypE